MARNILFKTKPLNIETNNSVHYCITYDSVNNLDIVWSHLKNNIVNKNVITLYIIFGFILFKLEILVAFSIKFENLVLTIFKNMLLNEYFS